MDDDFFEDGEYQQAPVQNIYQAEHVQQNQDQWLEAEPQNNTANLETTHTLGSNNQYSSNYQIDTSSAVNIDIDDQVSRKIKQEQNRIQQILRQKGNKQYEQKQARKDAGRQSLQEYFEKKDHEKAQRKQQNIEHEKQILAKNKQLTTTAGWKKVAENVNLKLGQYKGNKQVNRMRESIINKREDQKSTE